MPASERQPINVVGDVQKQPFDHSSIVQHHQANKPNEHDIAEQSTRRYGVAGRERGTDRRERKQPERVDGARAEMYARYHLHANEDEHEQW